MTTYHQQAPEVTLTYVRYEAGLFISTERHTRT